MGVFKRGSFSKNSLSLSETFSDETYSLTAGCSKSTRSLTRESLLSALAALRHSNASTYFSADAKVKKVSTHTS